MIHLADRNVFITGSSQGVGLAVANACGQAGANVVLHGRTPDEQPHAALAQLRASGRQAAYVAQDLIGESDKIAAELTQNVLSCNPHIDTLICNAGTFCDKPFLEMDLKTFDATMKLNLYAGFFLVQSFAKHWIANSVAGRICITGSINGRLAEQDHVAYDTSKGGVEMMVKSLCVALAPHNIRVNGMAPGLVRTPLTSIIESDPKFHDWMCQHTPNGQVPDADVCGGAAVFLCSDAAAHVHGQMLLVDGGMSAWQQPDPPHLR